MTREHQFFLEEKITREHQFFLEKKMSVAERSGAERSGAEHQFLLTAFA